MTRLATPLIVLLLCGTALAGCASDSSGGVGDLFSHKKTTAASGSAAPAADAATQTTDIASNVRQAQQKRLAGQYDAAIGILSQLMLVASDDPRVIGEYGKTLAEKGRAQDAVQFLTRATELQPTEWSYYSALGVAYDQVGDPASARLAYEHALQLKPGEPSTLNNYALSRMLANDPIMARELIARAQAAGGASDPKIARNIALVNNLAPKPDAVAAEQKVTAPEQTAVSTPVTPPMPVSSSPLPPAAQNVPAAQQPAPRVVMQPVPVDPLAGPVKSVSHAPTPLVSHTATQIAVPAAKPDAATTKTAVVKSDALTVKADNKIAAVKPDAVTPKTDTKTAAAKPDALAVKADNKTAAVKPDAVTPKTDTKTAAAKPDALAVKADNRTAAVKPDVNVAKIDAKSATAKPDMSGPKVDTKTATAKPDVKAVKAEPAAVKMDAKDVKAASAKPGAKPEAKPASKNAIPTLRQTASVY
jgi:Flp pilus assembly protein TadD